jgi:hypothetical protein
MPIAANLSRNIPARRDCSATSQTFAPIRCRSCESIFLQRPVEKNAAVASPAVTRISAAEAFPMLVSASFPLDLTDYGMLTRHFRFIVRVAATVPLRRLVMPNNFSALRAVCDAVIADLVAQ